MFKLELRSIELNRSKSEKQKEKNMQEASRVYTGTMCDVWKEDEWTVPDAPLYTIMNTAI
jgi:hypothetical protein